MKKSYFLLLLFAGMVNAQIVNIPDANFKARLLSANVSNMIATNAGNGSIKIDINNDGQIQQNEALLVYGLFISSSSISDLTGIQSFTNLKYLHCYDNSISNLTMTNMLNLEELLVNSNPNIELNLSGLSNLKKIECSSCNLTAFDASIFPNLVELDCQNNNLSNNLNLTGLVNLKTLNCSQNSMSNISNLSGLTNLEYLYCMWNNFTSLDVSNMINLKYLACHESGITNLNVSGCTNLITLNTSHNSLTSLDVSNLTHLDNLDCSFNNIDVLNFNGSNAITSFNCYQNQIPSLDFSAVSNLKFIACSYNQLTYLNIDGLSQLENLGCEYNSLNSLNVQGLINLKYLAASHNLLTTLNLNGLQNLLSLAVNGNQLNILQLNGLSSLQIFGCEDNNLNSIDLPASNTLIDLNCSGNSIANLNLSLYPNLYQFTCKNNLLTNLDFSNSAALQYLWMDNNQLTNLDFSNLAGLLYLRCDNNQFTTIDVSQNHNLQTFSAVDNVLLESIYIKNGSNEFSFWLSNTTWTPANLPNLRYICADESQIASIQSHLNDVSLNNTVVNSYCSFNPGGNYNTITGTTTFDADNNGCNASDILQPNIRVNINDGTTQGASFSNIEGDYTFYTQGGSFDITPAVENASWFNFSPSTVTIPFANNNNNTATQNFCITANGSHQDLEMIIAPIIPARPGFNAVYKLVYRNKGNTIMGPATAGIMLSYDIGKLTYVSASQPVTATGTSSINFNYPQLLPFASGSIEVTFHVNAPTDTPAVNIGDELQFMTMISPNNGDENIPDNTFNYNQTVVGSFDPNDITCMEGPLVSTSEIGKYLHYVINFENTGTSDAENIVVKDIINQEQYDLSTLQVLNSSDPVTAKLTGNVAEFIFQNINLHSGGHGNILIKIKSKVNLAQGDTVSKQANIYFDYNAPVATNIENTVFQMLSNPNFAADNSVTMYPNPAHNAVNIKTTNTVSSIQLYDVQGRLLQTKLVNENNTILDISAQSNGVYFIKVTTDKGIKVEKLVKE